VKRREKVVLDLDSDLEAALLDLARQQRVAPEELALQALRERFLSPAQRLEPRDDWERRLLGAASDCGVALSHEAVSSEGIYD
jgi:hypothetical protein